jgi:hypothetical protein
MKEKKETFFEYFDRRMGDELMMTFSLDEITEDWNYSVHELFYCLSCLSKYHIKFHPDHNWHIVLINKTKARLREERKKDRLSHL